MIPSNTVKAVIHTIQGGTVAPTTQYQNQVTRAFPGVAPLSAREQVARQAQTVLRLPIEERDFEGRVLKGKATMADAEKPAGVIDSMDAEWSGVQTDLLEVKRMSDNTIRVRWRWRNTMGNKVHLFSSDGGRDAMKEHSYLLDPVNKKKHFVVTDAQGTVVGTSLSWLDLKPNENLALWAKLPAPPPNVEKITVVIAKTPPFEDVPLTK